MPQTEAVFDLPHIEREYRRWCGKIGTDETPADSLSVTEVLRAHFLIAQFFTDEGEGLGGLGPRDGTGALLHSAVSRQFTGYGGERKWKDNFDIAATVLFGLTRDRPFHDGNKRTALLSVLHLLEKQGYTAAVKKQRLENFIVKISDERHRREDLYLYLRDKDQPADDADVVSISYKLRKCMHRRDRSRGSITYRQLSGLLRSHGYELRHPSGNRIDMVRTEDEQVIGKVGFPGMSRQISAGDLKHVRRICGLQEADGYDSKAFFNGALGMDFLLGEYATQLRHLADR